MKRYYYYQSERGCLKHPESLDEIGVGIKDGAASCSITVHLVENGSSGFEGRRFSMKLVLHSDEWEALSKCRDVLDLLSTRTIRSGEMRSADPFYALRGELECLGYKNLGKLRE